MPKKYGVWAEHGQHGNTPAGANWCKQSGKPIKFTTLKEAKGYAADMNQKMSVLGYTYTAKMLVEGGK